MNKKEIEKVKKHYIFTTKHELDKDNKRLKEYIQLLEQKSEILDKVTDKLKEDIKETTLPCVIIGGRRNGKTLEYGKKLGRIETLKELLNIIEGEKNNGKNNIR